MDTTQPQEPIVIETVETDDERIMAFFDVNGSC